MIKIITDSSANISQEEGKKMGIEIVPLTVSFDDEHYLDGVDLSSDEFYEKLTKKKIFPKSSQPSVDMFDKAFAKMTKDGDSVIAILISTALSGTFNSATLAKEQGGYKNVHVYDTLGTTVMIRLLVDVALKNANKSVEEVLTILDDVRSRMKLFAVIDNLDYLHKGGRLKKSAATIGNLLNLKPMITIPMEGKVEMFGKSLGLKAAVKKLNKIFKADELDKEHEVYFIYSMHRKNSDMLIDAIGYPEEYKKKALNLCSVIGTHIGPGAAGVIYITKK